MKKYKYILASLLISVASFAQVGIGTNTPETSSVLELKAADKALLLTRVANTAAVTSPVNGMMVYDISTNCIKGYQNGTWTGCLSACGGSSITGGDGGDFGLDFTSTFKSMSYAGQSGIGAMSSGGITPAGEVFLWGRGANLNTVANVSMFTPVYRPLPNGEKGSRILVNDGYQSSHIAMVLTESNKIYLRGIDIPADNVSYIPAFGRVPVPNVWTQLIVNGESTFIDFACDKLEARYSANSIVIGSSGKAYYSGAGLAAVASDNASVYTQIVFPVGVSSFTKVWMPRDDGDAQGAAYIKGNNNKIYTFGIYNANSGYLLGSNGTVNAPWNVAPIEVSFPVGVDIVDIQANDYTVLALAVDGKAYGWGYQGSSPNYVFAANTLASNLAGYQNTHVKVPTELIRPSGTKFTKVLVGGLSTGTLTVVYTDANKAYVKGWNEYALLMDPIDVPDQIQTPGHWVDAADKLNYNSSSPIWASFKEVFDLGISVYATLPSNKGYTWGKNYISGSNNGTGYSNSIANFFRPTPIATGIGDPNNPNPLY